MWQTQILICLNLWIFMNFKMIRHKFSIYDSEHQLIYTVSQKKTSHFNFWYNFVICWDILAPCSGLIAGWCNLLHTHHWCKAFTWRDVTHNLIQAVVHSVHWHRISYHLTYGTRCSLCQSNEWRLGDKVVCFSVTQCREQCERTYQGSE